MIDKVEIFERIFFMKIIFKILSFLFIAVIFLNAFAACDSGTATETVETLANVEATEDTRSEAVSGTESQSEFETEYVSGSESEAMPAVEKTNYGSDFFLWIMSGVSNRFEYYYVEDGQNDVLSEAIFARQQRVYEHLGVEIVGSGYPNYNDYTSFFKNAVKNKDGSVDMLLSHVYYDVPGLITGNYVMDLDSLQGVDLDADYWNRAFMDDLDLGDKYYLGFSDYNILYTHVISFNKTMMDKYSDALDKSVYDMVRDYEWTVDRMISLAKLVYVDATADGKTSDDTFGITGRQWNEFPGFLHACDINIIEQDESGAYKLSFMNEVNAPKTVALIEKLHELSKSDCAYFDYKTNDTPTVPFTTGRTLLHLTATTSLAEFLSYDISFGVLPYPLCDTAQKDVGYRHLQWGGFITVPVYLRNAQMTGETLEMLAFYSEDVKTVYYEKMLGKQVADVPDDSEMLSLVWDTVCTEFAQPYCESLGGNSILYVVPDLTRAEATQNATSYFASIERAASKAITKFTKVFDEKKN